MYGVIFNSCSFFPSADGDERVRYQPHQQRDVDGPRARQVGGRSASALIVESAHRHCHCRRYLSDAPRRKYSSFHYTLYGRCMFCFCIFLFSLQVIIAIQRKRRLDRLRHSLIPFYSFDANEEEDWDSDLLQHEGSTPSIRVNGLIFKSFIHRVLLELLSITSVMIIFKYLLFRI